MKLGRPSKYDPAYCEMLIEWMGKGYSFYSFGGEIDVCEDTLYEWCKVHPDFSEAKKIGRQKGCKFWELMGMNLAAGKLNGSAAAWIFNMKNRFKWTDRIETDTKGAVNININHPDPGKADTGEE